MSRKIVGNIKTEEFEVVESETSGVVVGDVVPSLTVIFPTSILSHQVL